MPVGTDSIDKHKTRVLLVADHASFLHAAANLVHHRRELVLVGAVCGGDEALAQAHDLQPEVYLIDLEMSGLSGLETIRHLRKALPDVGIIALTLLEGSASRQAALAAGADDLISKAELTSNLLPAVWGVTQDSRIQPRSQRPSRNDDSRLMSG
jgi:DNA-binding NarL/FixJ family response regulator